MSVINQTVKHYSYEICRDLANKYERDADKLIDASNCNNAIKKAVDYFHDHVFYTGVEGYYYYFEGVLKQVVSEDKFKSALCKGFPKKLTDRINQTIPQYKIDLYNENFDVDKDKKRINVLKPVYASTLPPVPEEHKEECQKYVEFVLNFIFLIISNGDKKVYTYNIRWIASVLKMVKLSVALILFGSFGGTGKSAFFRVLEAMLGHYNCSFPNVEQFLQWNSNLYGKLLVVIQELGDKNCTGVSFDEKMKVIMSESTMCYRKMQTDPDEKKNVNNLGATTNHAINSADRRFFNLIINTEWERDEKKFAYLKSFTNEHVRALYDFFMTIEPFTQGEAESEAGKLEAEINGNQKAIERMNMSHKFIKNAYALPKKTQKIKKIDLYNDFCSFCSNDGIKSYSKSTFEVHIQELGIKTDMSEKTGKPAKTNGYETYTIDGSIVYDKFKKRNLLTEDDEAEFKDRQNQLADTSKSINAIDTIIDENKIDLEEENKSLKEQIEELKKMVEELKKQKDDSKTKTIKINVKKEVSNDEANEEAIKKRKEIRKQKLTV